jgi:uncharacterized protein (DUF924 family)
MNAEMGPEDVLEYWFSEPVRQHWFAPSADVDREIARRFGDLHRRALAGELDGWAEQARGALALVILLDQFSRNLHRGSAEAYAGDDRAVRVARTAIGRRFDRVLKEWETAFLYMPFMHSERLEDQEVSVRLFTAAGLDNARYALHHRDLVRRFGRFPHRNAVLGRESTPEEIEYLASESAFRG